MEYFQVRYDSRVVIYKRKLFIRLATGVSNTVYKLETDITLMTLYDKIAIDGTFFYQTLRRIEQIKR